MSKLTLQIGLSDQSLVRGGRGRVRTPLETPPKKKRTKLHFLYISLCFGIGELLSAHFERFSVYRMRDFRGALPYTRLQLYVGVIGSHLLHPGLAGGAHVGLQLQQGKVLTSANLYSTVQYSTVLYSTV